MNARNNLAESLQRIDVCALDDLKPGLGVCALVNGQQVALFRLRNGDVFAIGNHDPFSGANVISRGLTGDIKGRKVVASPLYKQHFDLATGECLENPALRLQVFGVQVRGGRVQVLA